MVTRETKLGIIFAIITIIFGGIQPILANARPDILDSHIFSGMSTLLQALIFLPVFLIEFRLNKKKSDPPDLNELKPGHRLYFGKNKWILFIIIGLMFSLAFFFYYEGLLLAGAINGTLAQKSTAFYGLIFGFMLLKERVTKIQIVFSVVLFFGMALAVTQGAFYLLISIDLGVIYGVILILLCCAIWMVGHTCSKPYLNSGITTPSEMMVMRNSISATVLIGTYLFIFGPYHALLIILDPLNAFFYVLMAFVYGANLFCWYQILKYLDVSIGTIIITPQIIVTAFFGTIFLGEAFTIFHLLGLIIIIGSIIVISYQSKSK